MSHISKNKTKTLSRVRRIKGQVEAIERALEGEGECEEILQLVASCRGALNGLMAELIEGHLRFSRPRPRAENTPSPASGGRRPDRRGEDAISTEKPGDLMAATHETATHVHEHEMHSDHSPSAAPRRPRS